MEEPPRKRGRPKLFLTKKMEERRLLKRLCRNSRRNLQVQTGEAPTREGTDATLDEIGGLGPLDEILESSNVVVEHPPDATLDEIGGLGPLDEICCPRCARKVRAVDDTYHCDNCAKETNDFKPRYKLIVRAQDKSGMTTFTLFNKEAEQLIGVPVENIISGLPEDSNITDIPPFIKNIVGKKCAFDIKINAYNTDRGYEDFTVYRLTESGATMNQELAKHVEGNNKKKQRLA